MKKALLTFFVILSSAFSTWAYESDSHLRLSYVLARAAGISDEVAKYLSIGNQYIDETAMTSAMLLSAQRQLYHFHGDATDISTSGHGGTGLLGRIFKSKLSLAERNHALGSVFLYHGLVQGDLQLFSAGTHTKMDTFGHAGFSNLLGHAPDGHSPDRAFLEPKKYEDMIREMLASYVALKAVLPPEFIDNAGALKYLNTYAKSTHLKRDLNASDLNNSVTLQTAVLGDTELQSIYREDMYRKYEYKILALRRIYEEFKRDGKINADVTFEEVFPDELIRDPRADTTTVIMQSLIKNAHSEFLQTNEGKDIFDVEKLLQGQTTETFLRRYKLETDRYEARLRELKNMQSRVESLTGLEKQSMQERITQEELRLMSGVGPSGQEEGFTEDFIKMRSQELAQLKIAEEISNNLTKDFIPRERNDYIKHQFEGENDNRHFESFYKDEAYRRFINKNFGVNWIMAEGGGLVESLKNAISKFKSIVTRKPMPTPVAEEWKTMAEKAANDLIPDSELSAREKAQVIGFSFKSKALWMAKHLKYVARAAPLFIGYRYVKRLSAEAKRYAHDHATEDMREAVERGKYKPNILETTTEAYKNVQALRTGTKKRCSYLMGL
jgi:hypothetical protein